MKQRIFKRAGLNAFGTFAYVTAVGLFMSNASHIFGQKDTILTGVAVLLLLVFSAALTGALVVGQPLLWYLDGKKKEALYLLSYTLMVLLAFLVLTFVGLFLTSSRS